MRRFEIKGIMVMAALVAALLCLCLAGCSTQNENSSTSTTNNTSIQNVTIDDFQNARVASMEGGVQEQALRDALPNTQMDLYKSNVDTVSAIASGKADITAVPGSSARELVKGYDNIAIAAAPLSTTPVAYAFPEGSRGSELYEQVTEYITKAEADGTLEKWLNKWEGDDESAKTLDTNINELTGENGTLTIATRSDNPPFEYISNNEFAGYDIETALGFCKAYGYKANFEPMEFASILLAVKQGKCDFAAANLSVTEEREKSVDFGPATHASDYLIIYNTDYIAQGKSSSDATGNSTIVESFKKTFIAEQRWQLILSGLGITLLVTICASILGTLFAFGLVLARRRGGKTINKIVDIYVRIFQGTPVLVVLLIFYYIVFGSVDLPSSLIAIIVFALNSAAFISEMLHANIQAVDPGQREAALASGFTERQAFFFFILPIAIRRSLSVYRGEIISILKSTSIVGYIALIDLTKAGDVIRSRTYEALFPLLAVAIIYLLMAWTISILFKKIEEKLSSRMHTRKIEGVVMR